MKVKVISENTLPKYAHDTDAGMDLTANIKEINTIYPEEVLIVPTGLKIALDELPARPEGGGDWVWELQVRPRSGLAAKHGITVLNAPGTIDAGYRGEIQVILYNASETPYDIEPQQKIAQLVLAKAYKIEWEQVTEFTESTSRAEGGFGSTGY
jgi:dUTP pyrophosphatase